MTGLLTNRQLMDALQLSRSFFYRQLQRGQFRKFEVTQPIGPKRYSALLVAQFLNGESTVQLVRRRA